MLHAITALFVLLVLWPYQGIGWLDPLQTLAGQQVLRLVLLPFLLLQALHWLYARRRIEGAVTLFLLLILFSEILFTIPWTDTRPDTPRALRVLTFNSQAQSSGAWVSWINQDAIDLACVQEVPPGELDHIQRIGGRLGFRHQQIQFTADRHAGVAIVSRLPFVSVDSIQVPDLNGARRFFPTARVRVGADTVEVIGVHLVSMPRWGTVGEVGAAWSVRRKQVERLLERVERVDGPVILLGDCNSTPTDRLMRKLRGELDDLWLASGSGVGATWPSGLPFLRIDYVYARGFAGMSRPRFEPLAASDHVSVAFTLHWEE